MLCKTLDIVNKITVVNCESYFSIGGVLIRPKPQSPEFMCFTFRSHLHGQQSTCLPNSQVTSYLFTKTLVPSVGMTWIPLSPRNLRKKTLSLTLSSNLPIIPWRLTPEWSRGATWEDVNLTILLSGHHKIHPLRHLRVVLRGCLRPPMGQFVTQEQLLAI